MSDYAMDLVPDVTPGLFEGHPPSLERDGLGDLSARPFFDVHEVEKAPFALSEAERKSLQSEGSSSSHEIPRRLRKRQHSPSSASDTVLAKRAATGAAGFERSRRSKPTAAKVVKPAAPIVRTAPTNRGRPAGRKFPPFEPSEPLERVNWRELVAHLDPSGDVGRHACVSCVSTDRVCERNGLFECCVPCQGDASVCSHSLVPGGEMCAPYDKSSCATFDTRLQAVKQDCAALRGLHGLVREHETALLASSDALLSLLYQQLKLYGSEKLPEFYGVPVDMRDLFWQAVQCQMNKASVLYTDDVSRIVAAENARFAPPSGDGLDDEWCTQMEELLAAQLSS